MSIYKNGKLIAGGRQCMPLLSFMWADHVLNDASWLNATTFSWQSGAVYQAVYTHLTADITGKTLQSETISGTTIQFYLADDGHKICPASEESNVMAIYNATGVAWYYIIDTVNQRFKLPRTKFGFTGIRSGVGNYVEAGLPNITGTMTAGSWASGFGYDATATGAFYNVNSWGNDADGGGATTKRGIGIDASRSSSIYGNSDTVQPKATEMYLYFYVGNFTQTALENTAGLNAELFNGKADVSTVAHVVTEFQEPTSANNYTWYRKYADGWVEQGGIVDYGSYAFDARHSTVTLPIVMQNANYQVLAGYKDADSTNDYALYCGYNPNQLTATGFRMTTWTPDSGCQYRYVWWQASGMAA